MSVDSSTTDVEATEATSTEEAVGPLRIACDVDVEYGNVDSLEDVMITDTVETHLARLQDAGFSEVRVWFRCLNWASFIASR